MTKLSQLVGSLTQGIRNLNLYTVAGDLGGAYAVYTPTVGGVTAGNATKTGFYTKAGKTVKFRASWTFGSSGSAVAGPVTFTTPQASVAYVHASGEIVGYGEVYDHSTGAIYPLVLVWVDVNTVGVMIENAAGTYVVLAALSSTAPVTFAVDDIISIYGSIEVA